MIQSSVKMNILSKDDIKENKIVDNMHHINAYTSVPSSPPSLQMCQLKQFLICWLNLNRKKKQKAKYKKYQVKAHDIKHLQNFLFG